MTRPHNHTVLRIGFNARHLADPEVRGLTRYTVCLLRSLSEMPNLELVLFCADPPCPQHLEGIRAEVVTFGASREFFWHYHALPRMIHGKDISVFHAPADRGLPFKRPCPLVVTVHDSYERTHWRELFPTLKSRLWYWEHELSNYRRADAVITVSDTTRRRLIELNVARELQCHRVHLAPAPEFRPDPETSDAEVISKYSLRLPYVLYIGGYDTRKNVGALVQAFDSAYLPNHRLAIVARKQWGYPALLERWKHLSCFPKLSLLEIQPSEIPALYRQADFMVNPSLWESFSFQVTEAMACGTPLLCSNRTAMPEIARDAAQYFDPGNRDELVSWLQRFATDAQLKTQLRDKGFERVKAFSWHATAAQTVAIYRSLIGRNQQN